MSDLITVYSGLSLEDFVHEGVIENNRVHNQKSNSRRFLKICWFCSEKLSIRYFFNSVLIS